MHRVHPGAARGGGLRDADVRAGAGPAEPRLPPARRRRAAAPPPGARRRRHDRAPELAATAVRGRARGRLRLGPGRARHEGGRGDARARLPASEAGRRAAARRPRAARSLRRGGRRQSRRPLPGAGAPGAVRGDALCARRVRRLHAPRRRQALLPDPGGREADLLAQGDGSRARRSRRDGEPRRDGRAARPLSDRPRPEADAGARDAGRAGHGRGDRRRAAPGTRR